VVVDLNILVWTYGSTLVRILCRRGLCLHHFLPILGMEAILFFTIKAIWMTIHPAFIVNFRFLPQS
jgi:hypothetical protein